MHFEQRRRQGVEDAGCLVVGAKQRGVTALLARPLPDALRTRAVARCEPAQGAAPLDQLLAVELGRRGSGTHGKPPQRAGVAEVRQRLLAHVAPERFVVGHRFATHRARRSLDCGRCSREAHGELAPLMARCGNRERLAAPFVHAPDGFVRRALEPQRRLRLRQRQALERDLEEHAQRAQRAGHDARDIEAGDVLHHAPAEAQVVAAPVEDAHAEHQIAHRARVRASRPGQSAGDGTAERRAGTEMRRLEREHLALRGHRGLELGQGRARPRGDDELRGIVVDDARARGGVEHLARGGLAVEILRAAAANAQRLRRRRGGANALLPLRDEAFHQRCAPPSLAR